MAITQSKVLSDITSTTNDTITTYSLTCFLKKSCIINSTILDQRGLTLWEQNSTHPKGESQIVLEVPTLNPGKYNCWVKIDGKMHRRPILISSKVRKNLVGSFMKHFL